MLNSILLKHCRSQFITRKIIYCNRHSLRFQTPFINQNTFQLQILSYFEETIRAYKESQQNAVSTRIVENFPENKSLNTQLAYIHNCITNFSNSPIHYRELNKINALCISVIDQLDPLEILKILISLLKNVPNKKITFYEKAFLVLFENLKNGLLSDHGTVQYIYFMSLNQETYSNEIRLLEHLLPPIGNLPLIEKCIIGMSLFRSNYTLNYSQEKEFCYALEKHADTLINQPQLLTSLCKIVRISQLCKELLFENLSEAIIASKNLMNFITIAHVISLYAEANLLNQKVINRIIEESTQLIRQDINHLNIRLKDLTRFLWAASHLRIVFSNDLKVLLQEYIRRRLPELTKENNLGYLVDTLLSLHILECWNDEVVTYCFQGKVFEPIMHKNFHWKIKFRLQILLKQIFLEMKIKTPRILKTNVRSICKSSQNLDFIMEVGSALINENVITKMMLEYPINALFIQGLTLITDMNKYHIDLLNSSTCLRNTNIPNGLMSLKMRLISKLGYQHILLNKNIFEEDAMVAQSKIYKKIKNIIINDIKNNESQKSFDSEKNYIIS